MHRGGFIRGLFIAILLIAVVGGAAYYAYGAGIAQGLADSGKLVAPTAPIAPYPCFGMHPFGFGFGPLGCIFPFLFFLLFFALVRGFLWRGHWGAEGHSVPPKFEEWHKRAHEPQSAENN